MGYLPAARLTVLLLLAAALAGCATRNVVSDGEDKNLMLRGNDLSRTSR